MRIKSTTPVPKEKPSLTYKKYIIAKDSPVYIQCIKYSSGEANRNENSTGSVIPVIIEVIAPDVISPSTSFFLSFLAALVIASPIAGIPNIIITKNPTRKDPEVGSPAMNLGISPLTISPFGV